MENLEEEKEKILKIVDKHLLDIENCMDRFSILSDSIALLPSGFGYNPFRIALLDFQISRMLNFEKPLELFLIKTNLFKYLYLISPHRRAATKEETIGELENMKLRVEKLKDILQNNIYLLPAVSQYQYIRQICLWPSYSLALDFGDYSQFVVLLGDNAQGKTIILKDIVGNSVSLCFKNNKAIAMRGKIKPRDKPEFVLGYDDRLIDREFAIETENNEKISLLGYSASRVTLQSEHNTISSDSLRASSTKHLLSNDPLPLLNIETWLKNKRLDGFDDLVKQVCLMLAKMTPECKSVELRGSKVIYTDIFGVEYSFLELSMGQKTIIALMGDIAIRLFDLQPEVEKVEDLQGIVLIDELEAHLHPKWQREFPTLLKTYLPKVQFIVSTHSPMIVLGMPENTCYFHVQKDQEGNIQAEKVEIDVKNMLPNQILTSPLFGLASDEILAAPNEGLENLHTETNFEELESRKSLFERLRQKAKDYETNKNAEK